MNIKNMEKLDVENINRGIKNCPNTKLVHKNEFEHDLNDERILNEKEEIAQCERENKDVLHTNISSIGTLFCLLKVFFSMQRVKRAF